MIKKAFIILAIVLLAACAQKTEEPFKVGVVAPVSGGNAWIGEFVVGALEMAAEDVNAKGAINGREVKLVLEDADNAAKSTTATNKLIQQDGVDVIYSVTTPVTAGASAVAEQDQIPLFGFTAVQSYAKKNTWVFSDLRDINQECTLLAKAALRNGHTRLGFLVNDADFGVECVDTFKREFVPFGGEIVANEMKVSNDPDARTSVTKLKNANPDGVVLLCWPPDCNLIYKQMIELDFVPQFYLPVGTPLAANAISMKELPKDRLLANAFAGDQGLNPDQPTPEFANFRAALEKKLGKTLAGPVDAAIAFDNLHEIVEAAKDCEPLTNECLRSELAATDYQGVAGHIVFNGKHTAARPARVVQYKEGAWVAVK